MRKININNEQFMSAYVDGLSDIKIGRILNCSAETVRNNRIKLNLPANSKKSKLNLDDVKSLCDLGLSDYKIGEELGVNHSTVFSFRKKHNIHRESLKLNKPIILNCLQRSLISGSLNGDLHLRKLNVSASGKVEHSLSQLEYLKFKHEILHNICTDIKYSNRIDHRTDREYSSGYFYLKANPELDMFYDGSYVNGMRMFNSDILSEFDEFSLAVYYMDDGYLAQSGNYIAMKKLHVESKELFRSFIFDKFNITSKLHGDRLYFSKSSNFEDVIKSHVIPSLRYKLHSDFTQ